MIKSLFFILIMLLSGCTTDFSGLEKPEESVYIRFSSCADVKADVEPSYATRGGYTTPGRSVGILGVATNEELMDEVTLAGHDEASLRQWMANDIYNLQGTEIAQSNGQSPMFPIEKGSAIVAYAYMPHTERLEYDGNGYYIPIDLSTDSASTDWMYSGKTAKSKADYRADETFIFDFKHAMTRVDVVITLPYSVTRYHKVEILAVELGVNSSKGRLAVEDGLITMEEADSTQHIHRTSGRLFNKYTDAPDTTTFYLMPYTEIHHLRVVGLRDESPFDYESVIADSAQWKSRFLKPGVCSTINVKNLVKNIENL